MKAFLVVAMQGDRSVNEYARMANVGGGQMSQRLTDLGELNRYHRPGHNLVESRPDPMDRRLTLVRLTSQGRAFARRIADAVQSKRVVAVAA
jgi:DNA-binding MarR family transcriptional regulator